MFFMDGTQKKMKLSRKVITHPSFASFFVCEIKNNKYMTVKVCKIWCNDAYMSILQCGIFWWKLIYRNFFNLIFNTKVVLRASPLFCSFHCFARDYLQSGYSDMLDISYLFNNNTQVY
jgi:hypothetical protein